MYRQIIIILSIVVFLLFNRCSKELGNYKYGELNEVNISGLLAGDHDTDRIFNLPFKGTLELNPTVEGTLSGADHKKLTFEWKIDDKIISNTLNLKFTANEKYGKLPGEFIVTDNETGFKKYYHFFINIVNPFKLGYYVLAKNADDEAILYCKSTLVKESVFEKVLIPNMVLGKNPLTIGGVREYGNSSTDYYNKLIFGIRNSANPVFMIDTREFLPILVYNNEAYVGDKTNFNFQPTEVMIDSFFPVIYVVNDGKIHILQKGGIDLPIFSKDPNHYSAGFGSLVKTNSSGHRFLSFYDTKNKTMRLLDNSISNISYDFTKSYDQIVEPSLFKNQKFITGCQTNLDGNVKMMYLMLEGQTLKSYKVNYDSKRIPTDVVKLAENAIPGDGIVTSAYYDFMSNFWYLSTSRAIFRASHLGLEFQPYVELPQDFTGTIKKFKIMNNRLMIGAYDEGFAGDKKSSVFLYNINTMQLIFRDEHVTEEIIDLHIGN
ncbi:PKD-like family lipoprotein [Sphingobacterium sp. HJSM2_6]|uniref:PKD-like family lipoprotein n=1 Tax=Sphingobacterium sp. HJSM2_6 TaxID=3366264 RepID=UPI003BC0689D